MTDKYLSKLKSGESVLDIGCGNGKLVTGLPKGVSYLGNDFSKTLLAEAKLLHPEHEFRYGDVLSSEDWDQLGEYNAIFCVAVMHHIPSREQQLFVLRNAKKHLAKGGFLYLTVWNLWQERFLQYHLDGYALVPYNKEWKRYCVTYDVATLTQLLSESGWNVDELFYANAIGEKVGIADGQNLVAVAR